MLFSEPPACASEEIKRIVTLSGRPQRTYLGSSKTKTYQDKRRSFSKRPHWEVERGGGVLRARLLFLLLTVGSLLVAACGTGDGSAAGTSVPTASREWAAQRLRGSGSDAAILMRTHHEGNRVEVEVTLTDAEGAPLAVTPADLQATFQGQAVRISPLIPATDPAVEAENQRTGGAGRRYDRWNFVPTH